MSRRGYRGRSLGTTEAAWQRKRNAWRRTHKYPYDALGWHHYYVARFNKTENADCAFLAMFYLFATLRDEETA